MNLITRLILSLVALANYVSAFHLFRLQDLPLSQSALGVACLVIGIVLSNLSNRTV